MAKKSIVNKTVAQAIVDTKESEDEKEIERVHVLQSFSPYRQRFKTSYGEILLPAGSDKNNKDTVKQANYETVGNLLIVNHKVFEELNKVVVFRHLMMETAKRKPLVRELEKVPDGYVSADKIASLARQETEKVRGEKVALEDKYEKLKRENAELQKKIDALGGEA